MDKDGRKHMARMHLHLQECFSNQQCLGGPFGSKCPHEPIRSHTIAKRWLRQIARSSHVYAPNYNTLDHADEKHRFGLPLLSINKASTHPIFCTEHDSILFRELESSPFVANSRTAGQLHFRAVCREALAKIGAHTASNSIIYEQPDLETELFKIGLGVGLRDVSIHYQRELRRVISGDFNEIRYLAVSFEKPLPFAYVGAILPEVDFAGNWCHEIEDYSHTPNSLGLSCFSDENGGHVVLTWVIGSQDPLRVAATYRQIPDQLKADAALIAAFEFIENVALSPAWWEGVDLPDRERLLHRLARAGLPNQPRTKDALIVRRSILPSFGNVITKSNEGVLNILR